MMNPELPRAVVAVGDAADPRCWSGIPYHFLQAAARAGFAAEPARLTLGWTTWPRRFRAAGRVLTGRRVGGYQYSGGFLAAAESRVAELLTGEVVSFSQHFPRAATVRAAGGRISYYVDATFAAMTAGRGLDLRLPPDVAAAGRALECENYQLAERVVTMAEWTAESVVLDCGVPPGKVFTVLPGANLDAPAAWEPPGPPAGRAGVDREFILGFVGTDWERKGLPLVCDIRDRLAAAGWKARVRAAGRAPDALAGRPGVEFVGFIDKRDGTGRFLNFLAGCDVGCLFSAREALGISTLEFLRAGVPVAGYAHEGPAETLPPDAGFRFALGTSGGVVAARLAGYLADPGEQVRFAAAARGHSAGVTWDRCVREFRELWAAGRLAAPFRLVPRKSSGVFP